MNTHPNPARFRRQRGTAAIELAFVSVLLCIMLLGGYMLGRAVWRYNLVAAAASAGARYLSSGPWTDQRLADAEQLIVDMAGDVGVTDLTFEKPECHPPLYGCADPKSETTLLTVWTPFDDPTGIIFTDSRVVSVTVTVRNAH
jgi:Flp pilus assembly protein TadG